MTTPAAELRQAACRAREIGDPLHQALAEWLDTEAATWAGDEVHAPCSTTTCTLDAALVVARQVLGTTTGQPETEGRDCPACDAGIEHTEHCPTPETHNAGCGCPSDVAAAFASCPGYEMSPSPCRCPCEGCKHTCSEHQATPAATEEATR